MVENPTPPEKEKKSKSERRKEEFSFVLNAFALALIISAIIVTFAPYADYDRPDIKEIRSIESSVMRVRPDDVPKLLVSDKGKPVMMVLYASWCSYCAKLLPRVFEMMENNELDAVTPIFISMDVQPRLYSKYLIRTRYHEKFQPIMLEEAIFNNLPEVLEEETGSHFTGGIPYVALYNRNRKMVAELSGLVDKQAISRAVEQAVAAY